jgi:hypothetical protein
MTEGNPAIHAARALNLQLVLGKGLVDREKVLNAFLDGTPFRRLPCVFQKTGNFTH